MTESHTITPTVIIDSREQTPLAIRAYPTVVEKLDFGDYGIVGFSSLNNPRFAVERKSLGDLIGSLTTGRERFMREIEGLRRFTFSAILIESERIVIESEAYRSRTTPQSILGTLDAIMVRANVHIVWGGSHAESATRLEQIVRQFVRGVEKDLARLSGKIT